MLAIIRGHISGEVRSAKFVTIQADETTNMSKQTQLVIVWKYINMNDAVLEQFFEFLPVMNAKLSPVVEKRILN